MTTPYGFLANDPHIKAFMSTEQFKLSEDLLDLRFELDLSVYEAAERVNMTLEHYMKFEYADTDLSPDDYRDLIKRLKASEKD